MTIEGAGRRTVPHLSHWGAFDAVVDGDELVDVVPHAGDPAPYGHLRNVLDARGPDRVLRPAVRRGWLARGPGPDPRRGQEPFVEVPWDEALDLVAAELDRVRTEHGNQAIYGGSYGWASSGRFHHAQSQVHRFLNAIGGCTRSVNSYSLGATETLLPHVVGRSGLVEVLYQTTTWQAVHDHTELVVAFGGMNRKNAAVDYGGVVRHALPGGLAEAGRRSIRFELVSPLRSDLGEEVDATWHPVVPGTDTAVMLALAHVLVTEGLHDQAFLDRCCVGGDRLVAYVLGEVDGQPKDPAWAAARSGLDADVLRDLARRMAASRTLVTVSWSLQRARHGEQPVWMGIALAALLGQIGLPGGGFGHGYGSENRMGAPSHGYRLPRLPQGRNPVDAFIPVAQIARLLEDPGGTLDYDGLQLPLPDTRLVYWAGGNPFHHHQDLNRLRRALGRPDTVVVHEPYWTGMARHADVVLPSTISLERDDIGGSHSDGHLIAMRRALPPLGEARDDHAAFAGLAERLGVAEAFTEGRSERQWLEHLWERFRDGAAAQGVDVPDFDAFWAAGEVVLPATSEDHTLLAGFRDDPDGRPLDTPSGRIELHSAVIEGFGYDDCPGHPTWFEPEEWLGGARAERYPLHLIANQPATRLHSQLDGGRHSQAAKVAGREALRLHPTDAAARGIADGDVVLVANDRGSCFAGAVVTDEVRPGVVNLSTGAWYDPVDPTDPCTPCAAGNPNVLTADVGSSRLAQGCTGQHVLVEVSRPDGDPPPLRAHQPPPFVPRP